jgi:hypothetical protein
MEGQPKEWLQNRFLGGLAGFELGVLGGLLMIGWFVLIAPIIGQPWWTIPNLLASKYFGYRQLGAGPGFPSVAGGAFQLVTAGIIGALVGLVVPVGRLTSIGLAIAWYLASYYFLWQRVAPLAPAYRPQVVLMVGFFIFGSTLGYHRSLLQRRRPAVNVEPAPELLETGTA